jgi:Cu/Zn superoxide dismutase
MRPLPLSSAYRRAVIVALAIAALWTDSQPAAAQQVFTANLTGAQQVPPVSSSGTGFGTVVLNAAETQITVNMTFSGLSSAANMAHIHGPSGPTGNAGVLFDFTGVTPTQTAGSIPPQTFLISSDQVTQLKAGQFYFNIHTGNHTGGEIRGQIGLAQVQFNTTLSGAQQVPAVSSAGTGIGTVALNQAEDRLFVDLTFSGLSSAANMAHIHGPAREPQNAGVLFDFSGVTPAATSGTIPQQSFPISPTQVNELKSGLFYFNIHTGIYSTGEIRGQILTATASLNRTALRFAATSDGTAFVNQTPSQTVRIGRSSIGNSLVTFTAASSAPWLTVSPTSGIAPAVLTIGTQFANGLSTSQTGNITLTFIGAPNTVGPITVTLAVGSSGAAPSPPFGVFETPLGDSTVLDGSVAVTGWALDNVGVQRVELWRDLQPGETTPPFAGGAGDPRNGKVFISNATFVDGARPDVESVHSTAPFAYRAGWGYLMLTWGLFNQGNGTYQLHAFAVDQENTVALIGSKTIIVNNNAATKPFGSIDTPAIGGDASGFNFGWGLTPKVGGVATCKIQPSGVQVSIDSGALQPVVYGDARPDVAALFPGFSNTDAAGGHFLFDWSTLTNGAHTISWVITDDCSRADGVGSRFFNVTTGSNLIAAASAGGSSSLARATERESSEPITVARGYGELPHVVSTGEAGSRTVEIGQGERIEIRVPRGFDRAYQLLDGGRRTGLPIGASFDAAGGVFSWHPAAGFLGRFRIVFSNGSERISVRVVVRP